MPHASDNWLTQSFSIESTLWCTHSRLSEPDVFNIFNNNNNTNTQGHAETFGGACAQSIKGAHGTQLLIGLCSLLICVSKWRLLYWYSSKWLDTGLKNKHRTEKTILSFLHLLITLDYIINIIVVVVIEFTGYGGFAVVNTTVVIVEKIFLSYLK